MRVRALRSILCSVCCITLSLLTPGESAAIVPDSLKFCPDGMWSPRRVSNRFARCPNPYYEVESLGRCLWHNGVVDFGNNPKEKAGWMCYRGRIAVPKTESENTAMREFVEWSQENDNQDKKSAWPAWSNTETAYQNAYCTQVFTEVLCESDYLCVDMPAA